MDKQDVLNLLKTIHYPGFSRDIVSFGMVESVELTENTVQVTLKLAAEKPKQDEVKKLVSKSLESSGAFENVDVKLMGAPQSGGSISQTEKPESETYYCSG